MSPFQFRLWRKMTGFIQDFYKGKVSFHALVGELQRTLDLANIKDWELVRKWYDYFHPLEEADSEAWYEMKEPDYEKIDPYLQKMKEFLLEQEQNLSFTNFHHPAHRKLAHSKS
jgi:hypothetical protein